MIDFIDAVKQLEDWLTRRSAHVNHRQMLLLCGDDTWGNQVAEWLLEQCHKTNKSTSKTLWLGNRQSSSANVKMNAAKTLLGRQFANVCFATEGKLDVKSLLISAGTLESSGILIALCPPLDSWYSDFSAMSEQSFGVETKGSHFIDYWKSQLLADPHLAILDQKTQRVCLPLAPITESSLTAAQHPPFANTDQYRVGKQMLKLIEMSQVQTVLLTAKRGRGKSWLTGWFIVRCLEKNLRIALVSSKATAVQSIFKQTDAHPNRTLLRYLAPDELLETDQRFDLIVVDEAASIPTPIVKRITEQPAHVVLTTTTDGYEGSGSGFSNRLIPELEKTKRQIHRFELTAPIRWLMNDPLEKLLDESLCLKSPTYAPPKNLKKHDVTIDFVDAIKLSQEPERLKQIYALLKTAHYQTTPNDLVRLLDASDGFILVAEVEQSVVGVTTVIKEGNAELLALGPQIANGSRRPRGHMSLQMCSNYTLDPRFCGLHAWRINRIAVEQDYRHMGIASQMLGLIRTAATEQSVDALTTVFGQHDSLNLFWRHNHFKPFYQGDKQDKASGSVNVLFVNPLNENTGHLVAYYSPLPLDTHWRKLHEFSVGEKPLSSIRQSLLTLNNVLTGSAGPDYQDLLKCLNDPETLSEKQVCKKIGLKSKKALRERVVECLKPITKDPDFRNSNRHLE